MSFGKAGVPPLKSVATAHAHTLACALAANADFGMAPATAESPMMWMPGTIFDSNVTGSIGHQPLLSATPAASAMRPAFWGGMTLPTAAGCFPKSVTNVRVEGSTDVTLPPLDNGTHSIRPG